MSVTEYLKDTYAEIGRTSWPTRKVATTLTTIVVIISLIVAAYLGALDYIFTEILKITL